MASGIQKKIREENQEINNLKARLDSLETDLQNAFNNDNKMASWIDKNYKDHEEIINALVSIAGANNVFEEIKKARIAKAEATSQIQAEQIKKSLETGDVKAVDTVNESSIIVGSEVDKDGNIIPPLRAQVFFAQLKPELAEPLLGKKIGDVVETPMNSKFTINEIYEFAFKANPNDVAAQSNDSVN